MYNVWFCIFAIVQDLCCSMPCDSNAYCESAPNTRTCFCKSGFSGSLICEGTTTATATAAAAATTAITTTTTITTTIVTTTT